MRKQGILTILLFVSVLGMGQADPYLAGRACMILGLYDSAVFHLKTALDQKPGDTEILLHLGISFYESQNYPAAKNALYEAEKRRTGIGSYYLAKTEVKLSHPELALKFLKIHLSSRYKVPENVILLDDVLSSLEGTRGWQQLWNEKNWYSEEDKVFQEALFLQDGGDHLGAINLLNKLEKDGYRRSTVQSEKAIIYKELGNEKASRSALTSAVKSDVRNLEALQLLAEYNLADGEAEDANTALSRVIRQDPARFEAYMLRAEARGAMTDVNGAMEDMDLYLTYFPGDDEAIYRKGLILFNNGKYLDAIQSFNRALELDKGRSDYYFARGRTYAATGTVRYADKDMSMALDLDPLNGEIWYEKGKLSDKLGDRLGACFSYQKAFQYGVFEAGEYLDRNCK